MASICELTCFPSSGACTVTQSANGSICYRRPVQHSSSPGRPGRCSIFSANPTSDCTFRNVGTIACSRAAHRKIIRCMQQSSPPQKEVQRLRRRMGNLAPPNGLPELSVLTFNCLADGLAQEGGFVRVRRAATCRLSFYVRASAFRRVIPKLWRGHRMHQARPPSLIYRECLCRHRKRRCSGSTAGDCCWRRLRLQMPT